MRDYELTLVVRPDVEDTGLASLLEKIKGLITTAGGQGIQVEPWGRRHLAYPIKKITEAQYFLIRAQLPAQALRELERNLRLTEEILRFLLVRTDE
jgi:small subunit ribosomal protein S6